MCGHGELIGRGGGHVKRREIVRLVKVAVRARLEARLGRVAAAYGLDATAAAALLRVASGVAVAGAAAAASTSAAALALIAYAASIAIGSVASPTRCDNI